MNNDLPALLAPVAEFEFFKHYWARQPLCIARKNGADDAALWLQDIDTLFQSEHIPAGSVEVIRDGVAAPVERWARSMGPSHRRQQVTRPDRLFQLYYEGFTVVLNGAHRSIPSMKSLCRALTRQLGFATQANVYITPPGARGFSRHSDDHEVLVLQLHGTKVWNLYPHSGSPPRVETRTGDLLYIPAGLAHEAASAKSASVHITLGLRPMYVYHLLEELAEVARIQSDFQVPITPRKDSLAAVGIPQIREKLNALLSALSVESLIERRLERLALEDEYCHEDRFSDLLIVPELNANSIVCAGRNVTPKVMVDRDSVKVSFSGETITIPLFLKPTLDQLLTGEKIAIRDLPGLLSEHGKIELARSLIKAGIITIIARPNDSDKSNE